MTAAALASARAAEAAVVSGEREGVVGAERHKTRLLDGNARIETLTADIEKMETTLLAVQVSLREPARRPLSRAEPARRPSLRAEPARRRALAGCFVAPARSALSQRQRAADDAPVRSTSSERPPV